MSCRYRCATEADALGFLADRGQHDHRDQHRDHCRGQGERVAEVWTLQLDRAAASTCDLSVDLTTHTAALHH